MSPNRLTSFSIVFLLGFLPTVFSQGETHLYLFNISKTKDGTYQVFGPKYLSGFNKGGYTNQPFFTPTGDLLVSVRKKNELQNDIWLLSLITKRCRRLTNTSGNEYSPQTAAGSGKYTVLLQQQGDSINQQVYSFPTYGGKSTSLTPSIHDIGYYAWLNANELALYRIEGESNQMAVYHTKDNRVKRVTTGIGRTLVADGMGAVYFIHKVSTNFWYLKKYDQSSSIVSIGAETPAKTEDFTRAPDGTFFMGKDSKLMQLLPGAGNAWKECADLHVFGIRQITRMAVSADGRLLALVATNE